MPISVKHKEKTTLLLDKGLELLWSRGYNGTSVNDIVKIADVPKGSFYFYFDSKEDFAVKALNRYYTLKREATAEMLENELVSPAQRLYDYYDRRVTIMKEQLKCTLGCMACNIGNEMAEHSEKIRLTVVNHEKTIRRQIIDVVVAAQINEEIDHTIDPGKIVAFIEDAFKGMLTSMKATQSAEPLDNFLFFLRTLILK
ncbi:TetR/AcrR family transcriptional regulator [Sinomicrobium weinanense]|uniref:TetR/AcrR family transcriptional regulator n=1 Tax=Sinomicrobium weinanense TaxID=2842200 RepID=A0A926JSA3_9FLAO|nr:TetR/AcrR family transcriptional regulator [Sinomicrobium weinanense]MBC9796590.1 TetR/AcrR family transcriptional regulator [Sinomicrobium weinanense]MBU3123574.1 TetR/AcrR family transcriptional regulator [Sinomicrobium weinanense]